MKTTRHFEEMLRRPGRSDIRREWIAAVIQAPAHQEPQLDGRLRLWGYVQERRRFLRVILLPDGETVHNAFFDRRFEP